jgi:hypothetical protein
LFPRALLNAEGATLAPSAPATGFIQGSGRISRIRH